MVYRVEYLKLEIYNESLENDFLFKLFSLKSYIAEQFSRSN